MILPGALQVFFALSPECCDVSTYFFLLGLNTVLNEAAGMSYTAPVPGQTTRGL